MSKEPAITLSKKQKQFVDLYLEGLAAGVAYVRAGYSQNGAAVSASKLLKTPNVIAYMEAEQQAMSERSRIKKWQVLEFLSEVITTPIGDVDESSTLCQEYTRTEIGGPQGQLRRGSYDRGNEVEESPAALLVKIKMVGKIDAIDRMAKMLGWYAPEKHQLDASDELADLIRETRAGK